MRIAFKKEANTEQPTVLEGSRAEPSPEPGRVESTIGKMNTLCLPSISVSCPGQNPG